MIAVFYAATHTAIAFAMDTLRTTQCVTATHTVIAFAMTRLRDTQCGAMPSATHAEAIAALSWSHKLSTLNLH